MAQFSFRVDPSSAEPLFAQIVAGVKHAVATGRLAPGDRLPSVRELARELVINPNTIARPAKRWKPRESRSRGTAWARSS
jgi:GntR family transcriptional regulator